MTSEPLILISLRSLLAFTKIYKRISDYNHFRTTKKTQGPFYLNRGKGKHFMKMGWKKPIYTQPN